jgi:hypothetical protein
LHPGRQQIPDVRRALIGDVAAVARLPGHNGLERLLLLAHRAEIPALIPFVV